jgi:HAD superfamily hydrolase (TIGR01509 family)
MTTRPPVAGVLLDLDGTLVDTNYLHTLAWSRAFADGGEWAPMNAIHRLVGMGGDKLVERLLGEERPDLEEARAKRFSELIDEAHAFPGAAELIRRLHQAGVRTVVATSAPAAEVDSLLRLLGVDDALDAVTTKDDVTASKPAPDIFETAMRFAGLDPDLVLAIGDSVWDVEAARAAGIGCVGVETGGFSRHELSEAGALHVYRDVEELCSVMETGPLAPLLSSGRRRDGEQQERDANGAGGSREGGAV